MITIIIIVFINTRLLERFAPIIYLNCEHVLFVNIENKEEKNFADFIKKFRGIFRIFKNRILLEADF